MAFIWSSKRDRVCRRGWFAHRHIERSSEPSATRLLAIFDRRSNRFRWMFDLRQMVYHSEIIGVAVFANSEFLGKAVQCRSEPTAVCDLCPASVIEDLWKLNSVCVTQHRVGKTRSSKRTTLWRAGHLSTHMFDGKLRGLLLQRHGRRETFGRERVSRSG